MITKEQIDNVVNIIIDKYSPEKIILFGSYAKGSSNEDSDLDILIIKESNLPRPKRAIEFMKFLRGLKIPIDLLVYNNEEINKYKDIKTSFINDVLATGKVLYESKR